MKWASAVSEASSLKDAVAECAAAIEAEFVAPGADLVVVFASPHYAAEFDAVPELVSQHLGDGLLIGCSGGGVIGAGREVEHRPGLAIAVAHLPGVELGPFHIDNGSLPDADSPPDAWEELVGTRAEDEPQFILLADPFSIAAESLLMGLDYAFPKSVKIGGLASGAQQPGGNALYLAGEVFRSGVVGVSLHGAIAVDTVVAQGCRPIGSPMRITKCADNLLEEVDGRSAITVMQELYERASDSDRALMSSSLFLGVVMDELKEDYKTGDFLIRNLLGVQRETGGLYIGAMLREHQTVQFHLRDADTSAQELDALLTEYAANNPIYEETGALLFQCLGRGSYLYGRPDHDTDMFREKVSAMPLTGFFCNGEIGPVGDTTYIHGYTSSFGIFRPKRRD
jgi:small ligand-binding sensory domain FIST